MPGRNAKEANRAFVDPLRKVLNCLTWQPVTLDEKPVEIGVSKSLMLGVAGDPVILKGELADGSHPAIFAAIEYEIREDRAAVAHRRFRVSTRKYTYHLTNSLGQEVLLYHCHPDLEISHPHLHVGKEQVGANPAMEHGVHIPTARVALESVVLFLIDELGVTPIHDTYREIIDPILNDFVKYRTWHL